MASAAKKNSQGMLPRCSRFSRARSPRIDRHPEEEADREQHLPEAAKVEILEALLAEPASRSAEPAVDAAEFAAQAAHDHDRERPEQPVGEPALALGLAAGDHRREEDPGGEERGRDQEDRELQVPGAGEVEGQDLRQVDAEEGAMSAR